MLCLRCRALPSSMRASIPSHSPMTRPAQSTSQTSFTTNTSILTTRPFSTTLFSAPCRLLAPQTQQSSTSLLASKRLPPTQSQSPLLAVVPSPTLLSATQSPQQQQTRLFSASASLGVKRQTFRPSRRVQKRRHGFLSRARSRTGRLVLKRRKQKKRRDLSW